MASIVTNLKCELTAPVSVVFLPGNMFSMDNGGNIINVFVENNGQPATLGGTISANVIRGDETTVAVSGAIDGNRAYIILPQACYAVPGVIQIIIKNTESSTVTTIAAVVANVYESTTDTVVDPGTIIPSVASLVEAIEGAVADIPAEYNACFAPAYSTSSTYALGQYVTYGGYLYRCTTAITSSESWTAAHWTQVALANDVSALKSAFNPVLETVEPYKLFEERGTNAAQGSSSTNNTFTKQFKADAPYDYKIVLKASVALSANTNIYFRSTSNLNLICTMSQGETEKTVYVKPTADCNIIRWGIADSGARYTSTVYQRESAIDYLDDKLDDTNEELDEVKTDLIHYNEVAEGTGKASTSSSTVTISLNKNLTAGTIYRVNIKSSSTIGNDCNVYYRDTVAGENRNLIGAITSGGNNWTFDVAPNNTANAIRINSGNATTYIVTVTIAVDAIEDIYDRIQNVETYSIPAYWESALSSAIAKIKANQLVIGQDGIEFIFVTDTHWKSNAKHSNDLVEYISNECCIPSVVFGGDAINTYNQTKAGAIEELRTFYKAYKKDIILRTTIGNHDTNSISNNDSSTYLSDGEMYSCMLRADERYADETPEVLCGYWDNPSQRVRYINVFKIYPEIDEDVQTWTDARITELPAGWKVILFSHAVFESLQEGQPHMPSSSERAVKHFADLTANAEIICWIVGHCHYDANDNSQGLMVISTQTDNYTMSSQYGGATMTLGTNTEQSFDCYQIDMAHKKIYITRIGAGSDREITYGA